MVPLVQSFMEPKSDLTSLIRHILQGIVYTIGWVSFLNVFFLRPIGSLAFASLFVGVFVFFFLVLRGFAHKKLHTAILGYFFLLIISSLNLMRVSSGVIWTLSFLAAAASIVLLIYVLSIRLSVVRSLWELVFIPLRLMGGYLTACGNAFLFFVGKHAALPSFTLFEKSRWVGIRSVIVGLILSIPVVLILLSLLQHADPIFSYYVSKLFSTDIVTKIPQRLMFSLLMFGVFVPFVFFKLRDYVSSPFDSVRKLGWHREATVVMTLVVIVIGAFLVVQWPYIFARVAAETDLSRFGVSTYSEYVKKGFGELLRVAFVLYGLIWAGLLLIRDKSRKEQGMLYYIQLLGIAELLIFVFSIFRRIWLYQLYHGMTLVRMYGGLFLLWLTGMVIFLALRHIAKKRWVVGELVLTGVLLAGIGFFNVEHYIAAVHPPTVNTSVDYVYLSGLSPDGYIGWKMSFDWASDVLTSRGLEKKPILDPLDRRDIAYAGTIVHRLLQQYHRLVLDFGSSDEQMRYTKALLEYQQPFEGNVELIRTWRRELDEGKRSASETIQAIRFTHFVGYPLPFNSNKSLYFLRSVARVKTYDRLDRLFVWNYTEAKAYERMKQEMPFPKLLELITAYRQLSRIIVSRGEYDYPSDIFFPAPFLDTPF